MSSVAQRSIRVSVDKLFFRQTILIILDVVFRDRNWHCCSGRRSEHKLQPSILFAVQCVHWFHVRPTSFVEYFWMTRLKWASDRIIFHLTFIFCVTCYDCNELIRAVGIDSDWRTPYRTQSQFHSISGHDSDFFGVKRIFLICINLSELWDLATTNIFGPERHQARR